jgi:hypothetical protein
MREFEGRVTGAPCRTDRLGKPGNIARRVHVGVQPCSARTGKAMLDPFSNVPAHRAPLARMGGVDIHHRQSRALRLVSDKVLQLPESPAMQSRPDALSGLDVGADVGQVFHSDFAGAGMECFRNDGLAHFVVDVLDMALLTTGDNAQLAFSSPATVGLETTTMGKVLVAGVPQLCATPELASAGCGQVILAHVHTEGSASRRRRHIGKVKDQIEIPHAFAQNQPGFPGGTEGKRIALVLAAHETQAFPARQREQRQRIGLDRVSALVEVDAGRAKRHGRNRLVPVDALVGLERLVGIGNAVNRLTRHLAAQCREQCTNRVIGMMVQCYPVPAAMFLRMGNDGITSLGKGIGQSGHRSRLRGACQQLQGDGAFHMQQFTGANYDMSSLKAGTLARPPLSLPGLKAEVSRSKI